VPEMNLDYLEELEAYFASGDLAFDFEHAPESRRMEILEFLEKLMDVGELADEVATKVLFKGSFLEMLSGVNTDAE